MSKKIWNICEKIKEVITDNENKAYLLVLSNTQMMTAPQSAMGSVKPQEGDIIQIAQTCNNIIYGVRINGHEIYYNDINSREKITQEPAYIALHPVLKKEVDRAIENQEDARHSAYDTLLLCSEATKIADQLKTRKEIEKFAQSSKSKQLKRVPTISASMDNLQTIAACAYAYLLLSARFRETLTNQKTGTQRS